MTSRSVTRAIALSATYVFFIVATACGQQPIRPTKAIQLFNGKNLDGLYTFLKDTKHKDPRNVFSAADGILRISGDGNGYVGTKKDYKDYHLIVEFKWGKRPLKRKYVRNSGILLHATGPDGSAGGTWAASIECQLAQGCVGDLITIRGKADGKVIPVEITSDVEIGPDKRPRWKKGGKKRVFTGGQLWWSMHQPFFKELIDTRGKNDVESPLGKWTKVECVCKDKTIAVDVNGTMVNRAYNVYPSAGRILLQSEGFELFVRRFELQPLKK